MRLQEINKNLQEALKNKDKKEILNQYEIVKSIDLEEFEDEVLSKYEDLIDKCNDLLYG